MNKQEKTTEELAREVRALQRRIKKLETAEKLCRESLETLRSREALYRNLLETAQEMIFVIGPDDSVQYVNAFAARSLGLPPEEVIGRPRRTLFPPHIAERQGRALKTVFETGEPAYTEEITPFQGAEFWIGTQLRPLRDEQGNVDAVMGVSRDITKRKHAEEALRLSGFTIDNVGDAVYWIDSEAHFVDVNKTAYSMLGYTREELLDLTVVAINPDLTEEKWASIWNTLQVQGKLTLETTHRAKDGRLIPVEIVANYLWFDGRELDCAFVRDITERKETEEHLRESENKFRVLAEKSPNMIFILQGSRIVYANERSEQVTGYTREEAYQPGFDYLGFLAPEHVGRAREHMLKLLQGRDVQPSEYSLITKKGRRIDTIITSKLIEYGSGPALLGIVTDITERKEMEKALLDSEKRLRMHAQEMEESNNALKVLLKQRENDKKELEENILANLKQLVLPYIAKLKTNRQMSDDLVYLNIIESNLSEIVSPFSLSLSSNYLGFTPREMLIADLVKDGKQDKDIAEILNISVDTVKVHRKNIRKKLGIAGTGTNLRVHLLGLSTR